MTKLPDIPQHIHRPRTVTYLAYEPPPLPEPIRTYVENGNTVKVYAPRYAEGADVQGAYVRRIARSTHTD